MLKEQVVVNDQDKIGSFLVIKQSMRKELNVLEMQLQAIQSKLDCPGLVLPPVLSVWQTWPLQQGRTPSVRGFHIQAECVPNL